MAVVGIARAQPGGVPTPVDAARQNEHYVIPPGAEPLFSEMLGSGQALAGGCTFINGQIARTSVLGTYTCAEGQVVLQLLHPEVAPRGGVRTERFVITVKSGAPPAGLTEAVAERVRAREGAFEWTAAPAFQEGGRRILGGGDTQTTGLPVRVAAAAAVGILLFWVLRRLATRRRRRG